MDEFQIYSIIVGKGISVIDIIVVVVINVMRMIWFSERKLEHMVGAGANDTSFLFCIYYSSGHIERICKRS